MKSSEGGAAIAAPVRNYAVDALRTIAVCFVVYIHIFAINLGVTYTGSLSSKAVDLLFAVSRLAVPVFFAISGWFVFSSVREDQAAKLRRQIPRLVRLLIIGTAGTAAALWLLSLLRLSTLAEYLPNVPALFMMFALGKSPGIAPLWFLASLIIVEALFLIATKIRKGDRLMAALAIIFFGLTLIFGTYRQVVGLPSLPFSVNETWLIGFAWFSIGYFGAKYFKGRVGVLSPKTVSTFAVGAILLYLYEYVVHTSGAPLQLGPYNYQTIFLFTPFAVIGILLLATVTRRNGPYIRFLAYIGKSYALGVFIIHLVVMQPISIIFTYFNLIGDKPTLKLAVTYSSVVVLSFGITAAYYALKQRVRSLAQ